MTWSDVAAMYADEFHAVIPLGAWTFTGRDGTEIDRWKKPLIKNWQNEPFKTGTQARKFWDNYAYKYRQCPIIGLATGQICGGYVVIDFDRNHTEGVDGYDNLLEWQRQTGKVLPDTWTAITGSGGYHFYYHTDKAMSCFSNQELGVDLRADGGYIVVPPSLHPSGRKYEWEYRPSETECAELDDTVMAFLDYCRPQGYQYQRSERRDEGGEREMLLSPEICEGGRHTPLISLIGTLNKLGVSDETIEATVRAENAMKCKPPLTEDELQREIFPAIYRWPKGVNKEQWKSRENWKEEQKQHYQSGRMKQSVENYLQNRRR